MDRKRFVPVVIVFLVLIAVTRILLTYKVTAQGFDEPCHVAAAIEFTGPRHQHSRSHTSSADPHRNWMSHSPQHGAASRWIESRRRPVHWAELCLQWVFTSEVKLDKSQHRTRRWNVIGSGLLCAAFAVVVLYTSPRAFFSPLALVVVAAIGLAAVLLQLRVRLDGEHRRVRGPVLLNLLGILLAVTALFADVLHLSSGLFQVAALAAVGCFSISSVIVLETLRKHRAVPK